MGLWMVFDVESIGLHGEGFAAAWVVIDGDGKELESGSLACMTELARGTPQGRKWVQENAPFEVPSGPSGSPVELRASFWSAWMKWQGRGARLAADCSWPVEARFLAACVDDRPEIREWQGPCPLHEIASFVLASGGDPLAKRDRLPDELPEHDPLADARQSARLLVEALAALREGRQ